VAQDFSSHSPNVKPEVAIKERRNRRLSFSCRLFIFGEDNFEEEATILDLSTNGCLATCVTEMQVGKAFHLSIFLQDQQWPVRIDEAQVRWVKGESFGLEFTKILPAQRERIRAVMMKAKS